MDLKTLDKDELEYAGWPRIIIYGFINKKMTMLKLLNHKSAVSSSRSIKKIPEGAFREIIKFLG